MCTLISLLAFAPASMAQQKADYQLSAGDAIRISVFQNPDLALETSLSESGSITFPLIGSVQLGNLSIPAAEELIAQKLRDGNFVKKPQVNIKLMEVRGSQVAVLGLVNKPGRFPLETSSTRLTEMIALAGGMVTSAGTGIAVISGNRDGKPFQQEIDIAALFGTDGQGLDIPLKSGDVIYVMPGNQVSILGQVNHAGRYPLENQKMRLTEVLTLAGGVTAEGSDMAVVSGWRDGQAFRKEVDIAAIFLNGRSDENILIAAGDEIYVHRAPVFYIYGEAQKPGAYRVERNMTVVQALAQGGGPTVRGTQRNIKLLRSNANGTPEELSPKLTDLIRPGDVLFIRESLF